jgi:hypothetical protein
MAAQPYILEPKEVSEKRRPTTRIIPPLDQLLQASVSRTTPAMGTDTAWALKLKTCIDDAVRKMHVEVHAAKPLCVYEESDSRDMLFELETDKGHLHAIRTRAGEHIFKWID